MAQADYTITTKGSTTVVRLIKRNNYPVARAVSPGNIERPSRGRPKQKKRKKRR